MAGLHLAIQGTVAFVILGLQELGTLPDVPTFEVSEIGPEIQENGFGSHAAGQGKRALARPASLRRLAGHQFLKPPLKPLPRIIACQSSNL